MAKAAKTGWALNLRPVPPTLKQQFKTACNKNGKTMLEVLLQCMRDYIRENSK